MNPSKAVGWLVACHAVESWQGKALTVVCLALAGTGGTLVVKQQIYDSQGLS